MSINKKVMITIFITTIMVLSALSVIATAAPAQSSRTNSSNMQVSTDLGNNVALISGSIGISIPNAINKNFTESPGVVSGAVNSFPGYAVVGEQLLFQVGQATGGLPPYSYSWQFFTVGNTSFTTSTGQSAYHDFNHAGIHYVVATVTDAVGNTAHTTYELNVYNPLTISVTASNNNIYAGQSVTYTYSISGGSGVYYLSWNLGNGVIGTTFPLPVLYNPGTMTTTYTNPGEYLAVFQVNDTAGLFSRSTYSINVSAAQTNATIAPLKAYTVINTYPYATNNITSVPENTPVYDTVYVTGGTGHFTYTIYWGDGTSARIPATTNSTPFFSHIYTIPAQYIIRVYVNDSIGQSVNDTEYLKVTYVPPTTELGINDVYVTPPVFRETASNISAGVELTGIINNGAPPYSWYLFNTTDVLLSSGSQSVPGVNFLVYDFQSDSPVPGTYHFELKVVDNIGNTAYANLTVIVLSQKLQVFLQPPSESITVGSTVHFYVYLSNVQLNKTGDANVTVQFNNGTALHNISLNIAFRGAPYSILYPYPTMDNITTTIWATYHTAMNATFAVTGTFTALATSNYGKVVNTSASSPNFYTEATSFITVTTLKPISVTISTIPYPAVTHVGKPVQLFINVTGGSGNYSITYYAPNASVTANALHPGVTIIYGRGYTGTILNNFTIYSSALGTYYFNMSVNLTYQATGFFIFYGNVTNPPPSPDISSFKFPFDVGVHILAPAQLDVTLQGSSHYSYADYTTFKTYLNITGSSIPYYVKMNFGGQLVYFQAYMNGTTITPPEYPPINSSMAFKDTSYQPVSFMFVAEYANLPSYYQSDHLIWANVTSSYPMSNPYYENVSYDEYAIPFIQTGIISSASTGYAPTVISFDATPIYGEFPNMHDYSYAWLLNGMPYQNTSTSAISIPFSTKGTYTVTVEVTSPVGETATASTSVTIYPSLTIVQVVSVRADITLQQIPSGNIYTAFAGPVDWNRTGTINVSFPMPNVPHINSQYYLNVSYSYTLGVTQYDSTTGGWYTYFYNAYSAVPYASQTITVVSGGVLLNTSTIEATINGVNTTLTVDYNSLSKALSGGFTTVNGNLVTINVQGSEILTDLGTINGQISSINGNVATINTTLGKVQTSLASLNASLMSVSGNVATISTTLGKVQTSLSSINMTVSSTATSVSGLVGSVATIQTDVGSLSGQITSVSNGVATIQTSLGNIQTNVSAIKLDTGKITTVSSSLGTLEIFLIVAIVLILITLVIAFLAVNNTNKLAKKFEEQKKQ